MKKALNALTNVEKGIVILTFSLMVICAFLQVINRNFFKLPIGWFDEASTYCMIYMALIGTELGLRDGTQIAVTAVVDKLKGVSRTVVRCISKAVVLVFSGSVLYNAIELVSRQAATGQTSPALHLPMTVPYAALVISFAIIVIVQLGELVTLIMEAVREENPEEEANEA